MNTRKLLRAFVLLALLGITPLVAACRTTAGAGEDVAAAGRAVSRTGQAVERSAVRHTP